MNQSYQTSPFPKHTLAILNSPQKSKFFGAEQATERQVTEMSSQTKQTEINTNNASRENTKYMVKTLS